MPTKSTLKKIKPNRHFNLFWQYRNQPADTRADCCPYCESREVVKRGRRRKKFETVQLYRCKACAKTFSAQIVKHKHYPLCMILDAVSLYNLGYTRSEACQLIKEKYGPEIKPSTLANWIRELAPLCRYIRLRDKATALYSPHHVIKSLTLNHQQVYQYRYHQAKLDLLFSQKEFSHQRFHDLASYLTLMALKSISV
jgi:transposase-like protein